MVKILYDYDAPLKDIDLMLEEKFPLTEFETPNNWVRDKSYFGALKLRGPEGNIDIWCLPRISYLKNSNLGCSINSFLQTVPLNVQALSYDLTDKVIFGSDALKSLQQKAVRIQDYSRALDDATRHNLTLNEFIGKKALQYNFKPIFYDFHNASVLKK
ncbi:MAG: hypothetical protein ABIC91_05780 [Nanoarchaeota archaeon]|nr:hypothetical protein [Nanoarchaeota archaeon]MBU1030811.1 hypothetical protein [Nanoarchaeota archaeon]MBU1850178.1 hypothetical protein [Nanoarchaeota archaeon]